MFFNSLEEKKKVVNFDPVNALRSWRLQFLSFNYRGLGYIRKAGYIYEINVLILYGLAKMTNRLEDCQLTI